MKKKIQFLLLVLLMGLLSSCESPSGTVPSNGESSRVSEPVLLSTSLDAALEPTVSHPEVYDETLKAYVQVSTIAQDTRVVPDGIWGNPGSGSMAVALYVKVRAGDSQARDPFYKGNDQAGKSIVSWSDGSVYAFSGCITDDGDSAGQKYYPPAPAYKSEEPDLQPGEVREGWVLCPAPAKNVSEQRFVWEFASGEGIAELWTPVERVEIGSWTTYPEMTVVDESGEAVFSGAGNFSVLDVEIVEDAEGALPVINQNALGGECDGVLVVENSNKKCLARHNNLVARLRVRFASPASPDGMTDFSGFTVQNVKLDIGFEDRKSLLFGGALPLPYSGWVNVAVPDEVNSFMVSVSSGEKPVVFSAVDVRQVGSPTGLVLPCASGRCLGTFTTDQLSNDVIYEGFYTGEVEYLAHSVFEGKRPYFCPGESASGVTVGDYIELGDKTLLYVRDDPYNGWDYTSIFSTSDDYYTVFIPVSSRRSLIDFTAVQYSGGVLRNIRDYNVFGTIMDTGDYVTMIYGDYDTPFAVNNGAYLRVPIPVGVDIKDVFIVLEDDPYDKRGGVVWRLTCEK